MDLASVGLFVDDRGAIATLNQFTGSAHNAGRAGWQLENTVRRLGFAFGGLGAFLGVRQMIEYADTWTLINSRIGLVTDSTEQTMAIQQRLYEISQRTRNTMAATSVLYTRLSLNAHELGRSHGELLNVVETVNAAMLVSGATGVEAAQSMRQLAQALGAGRLQGDEFRTVMEAMPEVARLIAAEMGVTRGELYKLSREGKISVNIILDALLKAHDEMTAKAAGMPITFGQAMILFQNAAERMIGVISHAIRTNERLGEAVRFVVNHMHELVALVAAAAAGFISYRIALFGIVGMYQLLVMWSQRAVIWQTLVTGAQTIQAFFQLARSIRTAADAAALLGMVGMNVVKFAAALAALTVGGISYFIIQKKIRDETEKWEKAQADLNKKVGEFKPPVDEEYLKTATKVRHEIEDMLRLAEQQVMLAGEHGRAQERLAIVMDAVNKRVQAHRDLAKYPELLRDMLAAIDRERDLLLLAEERRAATEAERKALEEQLEIMERFRENIQRSFGDLFYNIMNDGIRQFGDLFKAIKQMFLRMIAEMMAAEMMKRWGMRLAAAFGGIFGGALPAAAGSATSSRVPTAAELEAQVRAGIETAQPVVIEAITAEASKSWLREFARIAGPAIAGFGVGSMIGGATSNTMLGTFGGALGGAAIGAAIGSIVPVIGTALGAAIGGLTGAVGGFLGSSKRHEEELRRHREVLRENNQRLQQLRDALTGVTLGARLAAGRNLISQFLGIDPQALAGIDPSRMSGRDRAAWAGLGLNMNDFEVLQRLAEELGITLEGKESWAALQEAIELSIKALTTFGNNLNDLTAKQEAYNRIFGIKDTPQRRLQDSYAILTQLAPELMRQMGLSNLDLSSDVGRNVLREGFKDIYNLIASGQLSPELLGAFTDKNQLLDAILKTVDAFDALNEELYQITTDFPRAMDIVYYEQKFGRYGQIAQQNNQQSVQSSVNIANVTIVNEAGDTPQDLVRKFEKGAQEIASQGGYIIAPVVSVQ